MGHGDLQHAGLEFTGHDMGYLVYLFSSDVVLRDAIVSAYSWSAGIATKWESNSFGQDDSGDLQGDEKKEVHVNLDIVDG